jgi:hypothetical protein
MRVLCSRINADKYIYVRLYEFPEAPNLVSFSTPYKGACYTRHRRHVKTVKTEK